MAGGRGCDRADSPWEKLALIYLGVMLVMALIYGLAPPVHWDSLTYHLVGPTRYLREGRIAAQPDVFYLGFSQNVEMLYSTTVGLFGRTTAAAPIHLGIGLLALLGLVGLVRRHAGRHAGRWAGWTAALILLSSYNLWALMGWAYVDLGTLLYGTLALIAVTAFGESKRTRWIIVMGIIAGLAAGVKYNAGALGLAMGAAVLLTDPRRAVQNGLIMAAVAALVFAPWALKGLLLYGNPVYPFALGGLEWDAGRTAAFSFPDFSFSGRGWLWHLPILPFAATIFGQDNVDGYGFTLGAWLLTSVAALPLLWRWLTPRERTLARMAGMFIAVLWAFWIAAGWSSGVGIQTRLMIMAFPAFAAAGGLVFVGLRRFPEKPVMVGFIVRAIFVATLALTFFDAAGTLIRDRAAAYLFGEIALDEYLYENTGAYANAMVSLPAGSQVRLMYEPRSLYCPETVRCLPDVLFDHWLRPRLAGDSAEAVFESYKAAGDDYLLVFHALYDQVLTVSRDRALDEEFRTAIDAAMTPVWTDGLRYTLYGWKNE
ncbi:MAG: glycosyltransferase family 39 protein [Chloroflexi bacterium]|nr:glycosyltransferase family 39 protein [Chloroflexota bacterium]